MKAILLGAVVCVSVSASGCGFLVGAVTARSSDDSRIEHLGVPVETTPPGAEVFEKVGETYLARGPAPATIDATYRVSKGYTPGFIFGGGIGTAIDLGLSYLLWQSYQSASDNGDAVVLPVTGLVAMGLALVCDVMMFGIQGTETAPGSLTVLARAPDGAQATRTITVPGPDSDGIQLQLTAPAAALSAQDLKAKNVTKRQLGKILVLDIKPGRAVAADLGRIATNITTAEMQRYSKDQVIGKADVETILSAEKIKDLLSCDDTTCAVDIGGMLGTDIVLAGDIETVGSYLLITYRMVNPQKAAVVGRVSHRIKVEGNEAKASEDALVDGIPAAVEQLIASIEL